MANVMAMTVARDVWLAKLRGVPSPPRGAHLDGVRVYASDQTHFSIARALGVLGFPDDTLVVYIKSLLDHDQLELFAADLREMFGDRVFVIAGDNLEVLFATLKPEGQPK